MKSPKVIKRKNLKYGGVPVWGTAKFSRNPIIELDSKLKGFEHLTILCHEALHLAYGKMPEAEIRQGAKLMAATIWSQNYRRFER
jgi:hypothetical protein